MGTGTNARASSMMSLDGEDWSLAPDPDNVGREEAWYEGPRSGAKRTRVPWTIQGTIPGYYGVAWYWREFDAPANPYEDGRYLLRFWAVDYIADVWVNGTAIGAHEGGETPFVLDATDAVRPGESNVVAVRVLNPTNEPIDGIILQETPRRNKTHPPRAGSDGNHGGLEDSVDLLIAPPVRVEDLFVRADVETGTVRASINVRNASSEVRQGQIELSVGPAASGETVAIATMDQELPPGDTSVEMEVRVSGARLWALNDPFLYRASASVVCHDPDGPSTSSTRFGFREFTFEDGCFRLNGKRLYLRGSHTGCDCPVTFHVPPEPDLLRRDLINVKTMGFNMIRFIAGMAKRHQLDLCDEIGLLVYEESLAGWCLGDSPKMAERFDRSTEEMVLRDRNHASVAIWGLLNETPDGPVFRHAVETLSLIRSLDDSRMVLLSSGRWDKDKGIGTLSNPGSDVWENVLDDQHHYPRAPHQRETIEHFRTLEGTLPGEGEPVFVSEYGVGSAVDLVHLAREYEQRGVESAEDALFYRDKLDKFLVDWERWRVVGCFGRPEDFFRAAVAKMADLRLYGINALRANPNIVGYSLTGTADQGLTAEGLTSIWRKLKPGTIDALFDAFAPLRWCLFAEPSNLYRGATVRLDAVIANEDALPAGSHPVRYEVFGPNSACAFGSSGTVDVPEAAPGSEPAFAAPVFSEEVTADWPAGRYRFVATFESGGAALGADAAFYVAEAADMPGVDASVEVVGDDGGLRQWLGDHGIEIRAQGSGGGQSVILVSGQPGADALGDVSRAVDGGATAIYLTPEVFKEGDDAAALVPLENKGALQHIVNHIYLKDEWAKRHPVFDGLPAGGLMDYTFYRTIISDLVWSGQDTPAEAIVGGIKTSQDYASGLMLAVHESGRGRHVLNTLRIRENLGSDPVAERLLRNLINWASRM